MNRCNHYNRAGDVITVTIFAPLRPKKTLKTFFSCKIISGTMALYGINKVSFTDPNII